MTSWDEIARWAEFRAKLLRKEADGACSLINNEPSRAIRAALHDAAATLETQARVWRENHVKPR